MNVLSDAAARRGGLDFAPAFERALFLGAAARGAAAALAMVAAGVAQASNVTVTLQAAKDNTMSTDNVNYASGAGDYLFLGNIASGGVRRILVRFDVSSIPAGATVTSAAVQFHVTRAAEQSGADPASLYRLVADWGEGSSNAGTGGGLTLASAEDATWSHRFYGAPPGTPRVPWASAAGGGDFVEPASSSVSLPVAGPFVFASTPQLVADVQAWVDQPSTNFGWVAAGNFSGAKTARQIAARSFPVAAQRPVLTVTYTTTGNGGGPGGGGPGAKVPLPPIALAVLGAAFAILGTAACRRGGRVHRTGGSASVTRSNA